MTDMEIDTPDESMPPLVNPSVKVISTPTIECYTLKLRDYISRYEGQTKFKRLQNIVDKSINLRMEAYLLLMEESKRTVNTEAYLNYASWSPNILGTAYDIDKHWVDNVDRKMTLKLEKLMSESNSARSSMMNESIRLSYLDLGYHYYDVGNLHEAQRLFSRMRDYCTTSRHYADMNFSILTVLVDLGILASIPSYLSKSSTWSYDPISSAKAKVMQGLFDLSEKNYKGSARSFLSVEKDLDSNFAKVIAPEDIAVYGVILGMASLERMEFKRLSESKSFRGFLELVPGLQTLVSKYIGRHFGECVPYIDAMIPEWKLDIYLANHVDAIVLKIKENFVVEYFAPYSALSLVKMSAALNIEQEALEMQIYRLIVANKINARIDDETKSIVQVTKNNLDKTLQHVKSLSDTHVMNLKDGLLRLSLIKEKMTLMGEGTDRDAGVGKIDSFTKATLSNAVNFDHRHAMMTLEQEPRPLSIQNDDDMDDTEDND
jgi:COP9 signalosome complex subunit 1